MQNVQLRQVAVSQQSAAPVRARQGEATARHVLKRILLRTKPDRNRRHRRMDRLRQRRQILVVLVQAANESMPATARRRQRVRPSVHHALIRILRSDEQR